MKHLVKNISITAIFIANFFMVSCNENETTTSKPSLNDEASKVVTQAAPQQPILIVTNNSNVYATLSLIAAQTTDNNNPTARMFNKIGQDNFSYPPIAPGETVKFYSYNSVSDPNYTLKTWRVSDYVNPALSGTISSNTVQSTYTTAYWAGAFINVQSAITSPIVYYRNYPIGSSSADRRFIGESVYGNFNPTQSGNFFTPYTQINFGPSATNLLYKAVWSTDSNGIDKHIEISAYL